MDAGISDGADSVLSGADTTGGAIRAEASVEDAELRGS